MYVKVESQYLLPVWLWSVDEAELQHHQRQLHLTSSVASGLDDIEATVGIGVNSAVSMQEMSICRTRQT